MFVFLPTRKRRDMSSSHLILDMVSPNTIERIRKKQICLRHICSSNGVGHANETYTGGVPFLSSSFFEIGDFCLKDESGNALLSSWNTPCLKRNSPTSRCKFRNNKTDSQEKYYFFLQICSNSFFIASKQQKGGNNIIM